MLQNVSSFKWFSWDLNLSALLIINLSSCSYSSWFKRSKRRSFLMHSTFSSPVMSKNLHRLSKKSSIFKKLFRILFHNSTSVKFVKFLDCLVTFWESLSSKSSNVIVSIDIVTDLKYKMLLLFYLELMIFVLIQTDIFYFVFLDILIHHLYWLYFLEKILNLELPLH